MASKQRYASAIKRPPWWWCSPSCWSWPPLS